MYSDVLEIQDVDLGVLDKKTRESKSKNLVKQYRDSSGRKRFVGTPELSQSQFLAIREFIYVGCSVPISKCIQTEPKHKPSNATKGLPGKLRKESLEGLREACGCLSCRAAGSQIQTTIQR